MYDRDTLLLILNVSAWLKGLECNLRRPGLGLRVLGKGRLPASSLLVDRSLVVSDSFVVRSSVVGVVSIGIFVFLLAVGQTMSLVRLTLFCQVHVLNILGQS